MGNMDLEHLASLTKKALRAPHILCTIELLKIEILDSEEPFYMEGFVRTASWRSFP